MEYWGIEVKAGETTKVEPGDGMVLHLSQASLGNINKDKCKESVNVFVNVEGKKLVLCTLSLDKFPQHPSNLVFDRDFELSHNLKSGSVYFFGYKAINPVDDEELSHDSGSDFESNSESSDDEIALTVENNGKPEVNAQEEKTNDAKKSDDDKKGKAAIIESEDDDSDDSMSDDEDDEVEPVKRRSSYSESKTISNQQTPMPGGLSHPCKSYSRSEVGIESHTKAKHSGDNEISGTSIVAVWGGNRGAIGAEARTTGIDEEGFTIITSNMHDKFVRAHQKVYMAGTGETVSLEKVKQGMKLNSTIDLLLAARNILDVVDIVCRSATQSLCSIKSYTPGGGDLEFALVGQVENTGGCFLIKWSNAERKCWATRFADDEFLILGTGQPLMVDFLYASRPARGEGESVDDYYLRCCSEAIGYAVKHQESPGTSGGLVRVAAIRYELPTPTIHPFIDVKGKVYHYQQQLMYEDSDWQLKMEERNWDTLLERCGKLVSKVKVKVNLNLSDSDDERDVVRKRTTVDRREAKINAQLKKYLSMPSMKPHHADLREGLNTLTVENWENIPEADYKKKKKKRAYDSTAANKKAKLPTSSNRQIPGGTRHLCNTCGRDFGSKEGLDSHTKAKHEAGGRRMRVALGE